MRTSAQHHSLDTCPPVGLKEWPILWKKVGDLLNNRPSAVALRGDWGSCSCLLLVVESPSFCEGSPFMPVSVRRGLWLLVGASLL